MSQLNRGKVKKEKDAEEKDWLNKKQVESKVILNAS
jgi:DNA polymerase elongation subunit (family B)